MLKHYLRTTFRRLRTDGGYTLTNVLSLAAAFVVTLVLVAVIVHELSYDRSFSDVDRLYRIVYDVDMGRGVYSTAHGPGALPVTLQDAFPEVEAIATLYPGFTTSTDRRVRKEDGRFVLFENQVAAEAGFFSVFDFPFAYGDPETALEEPESIVLTHTAAVELFGRTDVIGETLVTDNGYGFEIVYTVTGVLKERLPRTHLEFNAITSVNPNMPRIWNSWESMIYVKLRPGVDPEAFEASLADYVRAHAPPRMFEPMLQPFTSIHLTPSLSGEMRTSGDVRVLIALGLAAFLTLLMAVSNYVNLSVARFVRRRREVGMRKLLGAQRSQLITQFMGESVITTLLAVPLALLGVLVILPWVGQFIGVDLMLDRAMVLWMLIACTGMSLLVGIGAGFYPAVVLSSMAPLRSVGKESRKTSVFTRYALTGFQLVVTLAFVFMTVLVMVQFHYMTHRDLGYEPENVHYVRLWDQLSASQFDVVKARLEHVQGVESISYGGLPGSIRGTSWEREEGDQVSISILDVGPDYLETLGMQLVEGGLPPDPVSTSSTRYILINETLAQLLELDDPVNQQLYISRTYPNVIVSGVVRDFHSRSLHDPIAPAFISPVENVFNLILKVNGNVSFQELEAAWMEVVPGSPFHPVSFYDEVVQAYEHERVLSRLLVSSSVVAIAIAYLGLLAMMSYTLQRRRKELAIRRVLGAHLNQLGWLVSREGLIIFAVSTVTALLFVFLLAPYWLEQYAYRAPFAVLPYLGATLLVFGLMLSATWYHVWRTATKSPSEVLNAPL